MTPSPAATTEGGKKMTKTRHRRLSKIEIAKTAVEERLLALRAMFGPQSQPWVEVNPAFTALYYLVRLARKSK